MGFAYTFRDTIILPFLELVECMGEIYAVVPASLDRSLEIKTAALQLERPEYYESVRHHFHADFKYMPLQFYIFQLQGDNLVNGALRRELPSSTGDIQYRWNSSWLIISDDLGKHSQYRRWFSCTARGSVIWVRCEDYLLQYDVTVQCP